MLSHEASNGFDGPSVGVPMTRSVPPDRSAIPASWPASLRTALDLMAAWPEPMALVWRDPPIRRCNALYAGVIDPSGREPSAFEPTKGELLITATDVEAIFLSGEAVSARERHFPGHPNPDVRARRYGFVATPLHDEGGRIQGLLQRLYEVAPPAPPLDVQLTAELQHRLRNVFGSMRSILHRTEKSSETLADFAAHLDGRLATLARTQALLVRAHPVRLDLEQLVRAELDVQASELANVEIEGVPVRLPMRRAELIAAIVHELATNATKFGALQRPGAGLSIRWSVVERNQTPWLLLDWRESGVRILASAPRRSGFGSELISRRIAYETGGEGSIEFLPGGVHARVGFPIPPA